MEACGRASDKRGTSDFSARSLQRHPSTYRSTLVPRHAIQHSSYILDLLVLVTGTAAFPVLYFDAVGCISDATKCAERIVSYAQLLLLLRCFLLALLSAVFRSVCQRSRGLVISCIEGALGAVWLYVGARLWLFD